MARHRTPHSEVESKKSSQQSLGDFGTRGARVSNASGVAFIWAWRKEITNDNEHNLGDKFNQIKNILRILCILIAVLVLVAHVSDITEQHLGANMKRAFAVVLSVWPFAFFLGYVLFSNFMNVPELPAPWWVFIWPSTLPMTMVILTEARRRGCSRWMQGALFVCINPILFLAYYYLFWGYALLLLFELPNELLFI